MKTSRYLQAALSMTLLASLISAAGCRGRNVPPQPPVVTKTATTQTPSQPSAPAPTISLAVSPAAIEKGQSTTLSWNSSNATSVTIDNGIGTVEPSGSRSISPASSSTYVARASGPGGNAVAEARVTVTAPRAEIPSLPPALPDSKFFAEKIRDVYFDYDQYSIREDARIALMATARALNERPGIRVTIEGHCDERGSEKYNLALGDRRANAVKEFLVDQGINGSRIETITFGEERNTCEAQTEECWQQNRRAHFVMR